MRSATRPRSNRTDRLRHDRGSAHIDPRRTSIARPNCRCTDSRADSCDCRGRRERNSACDRINPGRRGSRLSVVPYYNKPMQAGLYAHFRLLAELTGLPIILYDVPSRTACGLSDHTVARLAELPHHWAQGCGGRRDAAGTPATAGRHEFPVAVRRGCPGFAVSRTGWRWVHFSNVKRHTRPLPQHVLGLETGPIGSCTASGASDCRADGGAVP